MPLPPDVHAPFRHEAVLYAGEGAFLAGTVPFIREGVARGEPVLVVVGARKIARLRAALGADGAHVQFADMAAVGRNPARIIPAWEAFVHAHAGRPVRGIGEPIGPERGAAELVECHHHEALLNLAFARTPAFELLCPYDTAALDPAVVAHARRTHPRTRRDGCAHDSDDYDALLSATLAQPLDEPHGPVRTLGIDRHALTAARATVARFAAGAGLRGRRLSDLVLAVSEITGNSVRHGGGTGVLRVWREDDRVVCDVRDAGRISDPLAGRRRPEPGQPGGYGLWLANQLCDLVQIRALARGGAVRLHMRLDGAAAAPSSPITSPAPAPRASVAAWSPHVRRPRPTG
jgi:anti-sigma regulatory factor (Ser/Thr protein kinase)